MRSTLLVVVALVQGCPQEAPEDQDFAADQAPGTSSVADGGSTAQDAVATDAGTARAITDAPEALDTEPSLLDIMKASDSAAKDASAGDAGGPVAGSNDVVPTGDSANGDVASCTSDNDCKQVFSATDLGQCRHPACKAGACVKQPTSDAPCDDGDACTKGDTCSAGSCSAGKGATDCNDGNACTLDTCASTSGCGNKAKADGTACDPGASCASGACVSTGAVKYHVVGRVGAAAEGPVGGAFRVEDVGLSTVQTACAGAYCVVGGIF